ncbi:MAG: hypothetical protein GQ559_08535 [Desulfobulbaceae bacterium]|nr:hypothetical protein [Desulfobulbaceae bacterium]
MSAKDVQVPAGEDLSRAIVEGCVEGGLCTAVCPKDIDPAAMFAGLRRKAVNSGQGGSAGYLNREFADNWGKVRQREADGLRIITYSAGCTYFLGRLTPRKIGDRPRFSSHATRLIVFQLEKSGSVPYFY